MNCRICGSRSLTLLFRAADQRHTTDRSFDIVRCEQCGQQFTRHNFSESLLDQAYPQDYWGSATDQDPNQLEKKALVERFIPEGRILDVGCSRGSFLLTLTPNRWQRYGLERSAAVACDVARHLGRDAVFSGDLLTIELPGRFFDAVTLWSVFEHLPQPLKTLQKIHQILTPGGYLFISVPHMDSIQARLFQRYWYHLDVPRHLFHYNRNTLGCLLVQSGFSLLVFYPFSREHNYHGWKKSLRVYCEAGSRLRMGLYYLLKPLLRPLAALESFTPYGGTLTVVARRRAMTDEESGYDGG